MTPLDRRGEPVHTKGRIYVVAMSHVHVAHMLGLQWRTRTCDVAACPSHERRAVRRSRLSFEFLSDPWLCAHQQATEKVNPATVQRRSAAVADVFTATSTPISSARAVNVS